MKLKYYLRGAGIGMVVTAIVMTIAFSSINSNPKSDRSEAEENHGETVQMASEGEQDIKKENQESKDNSNENSNENSKEIIQEVLNEDLKEDSEESLQNTTEKTLTEDSKEESNNGKDDEIVDIQEATASDESENNQSDAYKVTIISGEVSNRIASRLEELGLIDSGKAFNEYMEENKIDHSLRPGTYLIDKGLSYKEIADILTKSK